MLNLGDIQIPNTAVTKTFAILAKRGAGKSYTAGVMMEEMLKQNLPFVVFDPIDIYWGLRLDKNKEIRDVPLIVFGVLDNADVFLNDSMGRELAHKIIEKNISCVISTFGMSKKSQRKLIADFSEELLKLNKTPRHVFIEEAHEFVPQRVGSDLGRCFSAVEALVVMGRNRGLGVTLINQRAATINKDVLTQIDTLLAFRNIAPQDRKALKEWVEVHDSEDNFKLFWESLPKLPTGEGWIWSPEYLGTFKRIKIRERETFHPSREALAEIVGMLNIKPVAIRELIEEFKFNNHKEIDPSNKEKKSNINFDQVSKEKDKEIIDLKDKLKKAQDKLDAIFNFLKGTPLPINLELTEVSINDDKLTKLNINLPYSKQFDLWISKLPTGTAKVLRFLYEKHPLKFTRSQLSLMTGIKKNTLTNNQNYLLLLKRNNLVKEDDGYIVINEELL